MSGFCAPCVLRTVSFPKRLIGAVTRVWRVAARSRPGPSPPSAQRPVTLLPQRAVLNPICADTVALPNTGSTPSADLWPGSR